MGGSVYRPFLFQAHVLRFLKCCFVDLNTSFCNFEVSENLDFELVSYVQAFNGHRGAVTGLAFRQGTQQLMSSSLDRTIKLWSVEDRSYIDTLYGHQSDVIAIDCLRQERILSCGRDRTLRLWKVHSYVACLDIFLRRLSG